MDKGMVVAFNEAYATEVTAEEKQLVSDVLAVWGKLDATAAKNPALLRRGIVFGIGLQKSLTAGKIVLRPIRPKRQKRKTEQTGETDMR